MYGATKTHAIHDFKATCRLATAQVYDGPPFAGAVAVRLLFHLPRPKAMVWKRRPMPAVPHTKKPDIDNLQKGVIDSLTGLVWKDDSQIYSINATKQYAAGDDAPHVLVLINFEDTD